MTDEKLNSMTGQIQALSMTLAQIITTMPQLSASQAAAGLATAKGESNQEDKEIPTSDAVTSTRNAVLDAYLELLQSVSSRD